MKDILGDFVKSVEQTETLRKIPKDEIVILRLDGKNFSKFTKSMNKPFDQEFNDCMIETTKFLVEKLHAHIGYTQSDEITIVLKNENPVSEHYFDGKIQKITSVAAGYATSFFVSKAIRIWSELVEKFFPCFDCRVFSGGTDMNIANKTLAWRVEDAKRNSVQMLARYHFSSKDLFKKNTYELKRMLAEKNINWGDLENRYKIGTFVKRVNVEKELTFEELKHIPSEKRPTGKVIRTEIQEIEYF